MNKRITELEKLLEQRTGVRSPLREEINLLNELAYELRSLDTPRASALMQETMEASQNISYRQGIARSLLIKGILECQDSATDAAMKTLTEVQSLCTEIQDKWGLAASLRWIGVVYTRIGGHLIALDYFLQSHTLSHEIGDTRHAATCLINIGGVHSALGNHNSAIQCFSEALSFDDGLLDKATLLWNMGRAYEGLGEPAKALEYFEESLDIRRRTGDYTGTSASLFAIGDIYRKTGLPHKALRYYLMAHYRCTSTTYRWGESLTNYGLGAFYRACARPEKAISYLEAALTISLQINNKETRYQAHRELSECHNNLGRTDLAFYHFRQYHDIKEEISGKQLMQTVTYLQYGYEAERKKREAEIYRLRNVELAQAYEKVTEAYEEVKLLNENLVQANQGLLDANQEKNELLGIVAHDLKNPLSSITTSVSLVKHYIHEIDPAKIVWYMNRIETTALHMSDSIGTLLELNAIETGGIQLSAEEFHIEEFIQHLTKEYHDRADAKSLTLHVNNLFSYPFLTADKKAIGSILDNLLSNAVKYSPHGKNIWITISEPAQKNSGSDLRIEVRDEGPGLTEADQKQLFRKFARLSARPTGGEHSTGLGLSIVKKIAEAMQGKVWCESVPGQGATFIVEFPCPTGPGD